MNFRLFHFAVSIILFGVGFHKLHCKHFFPYRDRKNIYSTWKRLGIAGPKASSIFLGNFADIISQGKFKLNKEWTRMYGKIYGYYEGSTPVLSVADPDMAREILIKQFDIFQQRRFLFDNTKDPYAGMFITGGQKWKRVRGISSPTFSGKNMKMMSPLVQRSIEKLMGRFEDRSNNNEEFDISKDLKCLTLDVIASTVFSYDTDIFNTESSIFIQKLNQVFNNLNPEKISVWQKLRITILISFPSLQKLVVKFWPGFAGPPKRWFLELAKRMITERQSSGEVRSDYIQLMLNLLHKTQHGSGSKWKPTSTYWRVRWMEHQAKTTNPSF